MACRDMKTQSFNSALWFYQSIQKFIHDCSTSRRDISWVDHKSRMSFSFRRARLAHAGNVLFRNEHEALSAWEGRSQLDAFKNQIIFPW